MTIEFEPPVNSSINDRLVYVVSDTDATNAALDNYQYVADIYVDSVMVHRCKSYPNPTNNMGEFELSEILRDYVSYAFKAEQGAGEFNLAVTVKFGEEYDGTLYVDLATSTVTYFNCYNGRIGSETYIENYINLPATDRPRSVQMVVGQDEYYVPYYAYSSSPFTVTINGTSTTVTPTAANTMHRINIAAPSATANYTAVINGVTFNVELLCNGLYTNYYLHFLNQWGGWETFLFNKPRRQKFSVERKQFQKLPYRVSSGGDVTIHTDNVMHQQRVNFGQSFSEKLSLKTDWLKDAEWEWLKQLILSPLVYLQKQGSDTMYPVILNSNEYEVKEYVVDQLTQLTIEVEFGTRYNTQSA